jgi:putative transposase
MPRRARMYIPGYAYHIVQRGNNRQACFFEVENYRVFLKYMTEVLPRYGNSLHAYCLMTNHVHLLITPECVDSISNLMKVVCSRYAQYINRNIPAQDHSGKDDIRPASLILKAIC